MSPISDLSFFITNMITMIGLAVGIDYALFVIECYREERRRGREKLDATIVRSILVPSTMALLGDRNWYLPRWLRWLPDLRVEGTPPEPVPAVNGADGVKEPSMADYVESG